MIIQLKDFLEDKWGIRDRVVLSVKRECELKVINAIVADPDNSEALCHLQFSDDLVIIWRPADWKTAEIKYREDKAKSEVRMAYVTAEKECELKLEKLIIEKFGEIAGGDLAPPMARDIVKNKKTNSALMFGLEKTDLPWIQQNEAQT